MELEVFIIGIEIMLEEFSLVEKLVLYIQFPTIGVIGFMILLKILMLWK